MGEHDVHPNGRNKRILVVEDHAVTAEMLVELLRDEGYCVSWAGTAEAAMLYFSDSNGQQAKPHPDLVLLDLTLPDMDAVQMVHQLEESHHDLPPVIVVSAKTTTYVQATAREIKAVSVVPKPFMIENLLGSIEGALHESA